MAAPHEDGAPDPALYFVRHQAGPAARLLHRLTGSAGGITPEQDFLRREPATARPPAAVMQFRARDPGVHQGAPAASAGRVPLRAGSRLKIAADRLRGGLDYAFAGDLEVEGDIGDGVGLRIDGRVTVAGDVRAARIFTRVPEALQPLQVTGERLGSGRGGAGVEPVQFQDLQAVGLLYPADPRPGIAVSGHVHAGAWLSSNAGLTLGSADPQAWLSPGRFGSLRLLRPAMQPPAPQMQPRRNPPAPR